MTEFSPECDKVIFYGDNSQNLLGYAALKILGAVVPALIREFDSMALTDPSGFIIL